MVRYTTHTGKKIMKTQIGWHKVDQCNSSPSLQYKPNSSMVKVTSCSLCSWHLLLLRPPHCINFNCQNVRTRFRAWLSLKVVKYDCVSGRPRPMNLAAGLEQSGDGIDQKRQRDREKTPGALLRTELIGLASSSHLRPPHNPPSNPHTLLARASG